MKTTILKTLFLAVSLAAVPLRAVNYDFLPVTITGPGAKFTSPNGNGIITVTNTGGPFLGLNNTVYTSKFPNLFPASATVPGWLAQADNYAIYTNTFYLNNYNLSATTVFGIWNITEESNSYRIELFDGAGLAIVPALSFMNFDDDSNSGNIGWYHMVLSLSGYLWTYQFKTSGIDCDAAFWNKIPPQTKKIVVTGTLAASNADGVVFYFGEARTNECGILCPTNMVVRTCGSNTIVNYDPPILAGACASNLTVVCSPPSGSTFPLGTNTVTCSVINGPVIVDSCSFTVSVLASAYGNTYDFLPVTITGPGARFTSPNGYGYITVTNAGGPFLSANNTVYSSQFPNLFPASGTVQGWIAQADNYAIFTNTFYLTNYALTPDTVFGIWNITEEPNSYQIQIYAGSTLISPPFNWNFIGYDDDSITGNIGWYHMALNPNNGFLSTAQFKGSGTDCDAAFWNQIPLNATRIVVTGRLGASNADGVGFYFAELKPCGCRISCGSTNLAITTCGTNAVVNYPPPILSGSCGSNVTFFCSPPSGSVFPVGTNIVTCAAVDGPVIVDSCSFTVTVISNCAPCIGCPPLDQTVFGCPPLVPDFSTNSFAGSNCIPPGPLVVTQSIAAGTPLPLGQTNVTVHVCDALGNCHDCVIVLNAQASPGCCATVAHELLSGRAASGLLPVGAQDLQFDGVGPGFTAPHPYAITPNGSWLPNGPDSQWIGPDTNYPPTGVYVYRNRFFLCSTSQAALYGQWTVDDTAMMSLNGAATGPTITAVGAYSSWWPVSIASGFVPGWNTLLCYVTNLQSASGLRLEITNSACCNNCVSIACSTNRVVGTCGANALVWYSAPLAGSSCAPLVSAACQPPSGSLFPIGTSTVQCTAIDALGNAATCSFTVTVQPAPPSLCSPILKANANGASIVLSWPDTANGFEVQEATALVPPIQWQALTNPIVQGDGENKVIVQGVKPVRFFRLRSGDE
ncbi:MAG: hypothetical protein C5B50_10250 [Verrucomicrobia bacterium]|nr:MAG: hypothetical protein C5B50_10250 [Verrucomicrobiota bacterium]